ncbi:unnamed protein product [Acidithrix sp. C25]|nr:unnamed protein product [Acidithrix sp. C25]
MNRLLCGELLVLESALFAWMIVDFFVLKAALLTIGDFYSSSGLTMLLSGNIVSGFIDTLCCEV